MVKKEYNAKPLELSKKGIDFKISVVSGKRTKRK